MSRHGLKIADKTIYGIKTPDKALELVELVIDQYFGEYWTQHKPRCPLCNTGLSDTEKHMNRPVGECTNPKCESTIHISDFMGKIKDVLNEWSLTKDNWMEETLTELKKKAKQSSDMRPSYHHTDSVIINEETVFVW